ncbi:hypothetical protein [Yersinia mollaretii]|uniref:hypothetical protein n=1 Tax=Yersinia mollaretii TaxID=33060 RepID=UPI00066FDB50|nr:hypothetical protein [Yersinia mollaretii]
MKVSLDLVINSGEADVDMDYAIETLLGTSKVISIVSEAVLGGKVVSKRYASNPVRNKLKHSFTGSYGQCFDLVISDTKMIDNLKRMGRSVFSEVISYYIYDALYLETKNITPKALDIIKKLESIEEDLTTKIRNPLIDMHTISAMCGYSIDLNYRKPGEKQKLASLDHGTSKNITDLHESAKTHTIEAIITRFNTFTGNGRLLVKGDKTTTSFGFTKAFKYVTEGQKKKITANQHENNTVSEENRKNIKLLVKNLSISTGEVIRYRVEEVE